MYVERSGCGIIRDTPTCLSICVVWYLSGSHAPIEAVSPLLCNADSPSVATLPYCDMPLLRPSVCVYQTVTSQLIEIQRFSKLLT